MKTKIFFAFLVIIFAAFLSNFIFEWLIIRDFENYVMSVGEDHLYWIMASVEGSYLDDGWDRGILLESIHWAMMLGYEVKVIDAQGKEIISSAEVIRSLSEPMRRRMAVLSHIHKAEGNFEEYPLYMKGKMIGTLLSRPFQKEVIKEKETIFKRRTKEFLFVSSLIAGGGALVIALLLGQYLSRPIINLKIAAEKIAKGNFNVTIPIKGMDEVGKLSESFNIMVESLRKEEELRKHLMSNIAHELRTPLTIMKTHIEAIEDEVIEDKDKGLENIKNELNRLIRLVRGIEEITQVEASFFTKTEKAEINLKEFLSLLSKEMIPVFKEKGLEINVIRERNLSVVTDIDKLERVIRNLLSNSLKFTEKGGVWIDYGIQGKDFFIEIKDSGRGIPENEIPFIFNRFYRIGESGEGLGLGLAIVKELVDIMGGKVEVKSEVNKGTIFTLFFQLKG
jgi:signal transduction histidine kinase